MSHSFLVIWSSSKEGVVSVAASSERRLEHFISSMQRKGWRVHQTDATTFSSFDGGQEKTTVLGNVRATYKTRDTILARA